MAKRAAPDRAKASRAVITTVRNLAGVDIRGEDWPRSWLPLVGKFASPADLASEIGISYQTLWRWSQKGDDIPKLGQFALRCLAEKKGVRPPV